ncbi:MAG: ORF6N domain-containing protein [Nitrospiraceae bacterium]|nr:ORF6N domain-containing protein [Nitrospiraceae bacterium]
MEIVPQEIIERKILIVRGKKVMLDKDLAVLYDVETKMLNRAVKRNIERFPDDFMFQLTKEEFENLRFNFGTSSWGGQRYLPDTVF